MSLARSATAEFAGTGLLMVAVIAAGQLALALGGMAEIPARGCAGLLVGLAAFALSAGLLQASGAHLNPAVSLFAHIRGQLDAQAALVYSTAQISGALLGTLAAHALFGLALVQASQQASTTLDERFIEVAATCLLLLAHSITGRLRTAWMPAAVGLAMTVIYGCSALRAVANPALLLARILTNTPVGVAADSLPALLIAQFGAVAIAFGCVLLLPAERKTA